MPGPRRAGTLVVAYWLTQHPLRATVRDHLYAFRRHASLRTLEVNLAVGPVPAQLRRAGADVVVLHTSLLAGSRWAPSLEPLVRERVAGLRALGGTVVALPQDEFVRTAALERLLEDAGVDVVCSVAPPSEWPVIYPDLTARGVRFERVLTGYLEPATVARIDRLLPPGAPRPLDLGYRARAHAAWLGRHGMLKGVIAAEIDRRARARGLRTDVSTDDADVLAGDDWFRFLGAARWTFGAEGGASINDRDGTVRDRVTAYLAEHPDAPFEAIEAACFPGLDGTLDLRALSPRHLEACATRTAQVLVRGDYNGLLEPGTHYVPLDADLGNLDEVLDVVQHDEAARRRIVEGAHRDVVASGAAGPQAFVRAVEAAAGVAPPAARARSRTATALATAWPAADAASWGVVRWRLRGRARVLGAVGRALARVPEPVRRAGRAVLVRDGRERG